MVRLFYLSWNKNPQMEKILINPTYLISLLGRRVRWWYNLTSASLLAVEGTWGWGSAQRWKDRIRSNSSSGQIRSAHRNSADREQEREEKRFIFKKNVLALAAESNAKISCSFLACAPNPKMCICEIFNLDISLVNPCEESNLVQVHRVVCEVHWAFIKMLPLIASPSSGREVDVPLLFSWLEHRSHHQVITNQELGIDLIGCLVIISNPPEGPYDWVSGIKNLTCQLENSRSHQSLMELRKLLCNLYHLKVNRHSITKCLPCPAESQHRNHKRR